MEAALWLQSRIEQFGALSEYAVGDKHVLLLYLQPAFFCQTHTELVYVTFVLNCLRGLPNERWRYSLLPSTSLGQEESVIN